MELIPQFPHGSTQIAETSRVLDDVVGRFSPFGIGRLQRHTASNIALRKASGDRSVESFLDRCDHHYPTPPRTNQIRPDRQLDGDVSIGISIDQLLNREADVRVSESLQRVQLLWITEYNGSQQRSIDSVAVYDGGPLVGDGAMGSATGFENLVAESIGFDDDRSQLSENRQDGRLAAADAAADDKSEWLISIALSSHGLDCTLWQ